MSWKETLISLKEALTAGMTSFVTFNSQEDIKDFVAAIKQDPELEDKGEQQYTIDSEVFIARYGLGSKRRVSLLEIIEDFSPKVYFESTKELCLFASLFDDAIAEGVIKEDTVDGRLNINYKKFSNEEVPTGTGTSKATMNAEGVLNIVAIIFLVLSTLAGIVLIVNAITVAELVGYVEILKMKIWLGVVLIINGFMLWALFRVVARISESLISINEKIKHKQ